MLYLPNAHAAKSTPCVVRVEWLRLCSNTFVHVRKPTTCIHVRASQVPIGIVGTGSGAASWMQLASENGDHLWTVRCILEMPDLQRLCPLGEALDMPAVQPLAIRLDAVRYIHNSHWLAGHICRMYCSSLMLWKCFLAAQRSAPNGGV